MKKLMFMLAAVLAAGMVQAATVNWSTGRIKVPGDGGTGWGSDGISGSDYTAQIYFWSAAADAGDISKALTGITGTSSSTVSSKAIKGTTSDAFANGTYFTLVEVTDKSGNSLKSDVVSFTVDNSSLDANPNLNFYSGTGFNEDFSGTTGGAFGTGGGWTSAPEPTSGILMLVGLGALALRRRKQA